METARISASGSEARALPAVPAGSILRLSGAGGGSGGGSKIIGVLTGGRTGVTVGVAVGVAVGVCVAVGGGGTGSQITGDAIMVGRGVMLGGGGGSQMIGDMTGVGWGVTLGGGGGSQTIGAQQLAAAASLDKRIVARMARWRSFGSFRNGIT